MTDVQFSAGGRSYALRYSFNAFVALEDRLNVSMSELLVSLGSDVRMGTVRALLWAGLIEENPDLTLEQVGKMIPLDQMQATLALIVEAFAASGLTEEAEAKVGAKPARRARK